MNTSSLIDKVGKALYKILLLCMVTALFFGMSPVTPARAVTTISAEKTRTSTEPGSGPVSVQDPYDAQSTTGPTPPPEVVASQVESLEYVAGVNSHVINNVPAYLWRHGCGPTAAGMVIGYWDQYWDARGADWLFSGNATTQTAVVNNDIASTTGTWNHYTDYAQPIDDATPGMLPDRSQLPPGNQHANNSIADFMNTSRSIDNNRYGWSWSDDVSPALLGYINMVNPGGFAASSADYLYWNGSFNWTMFKAEIDAGRPMVLLVDSNGDGWTDHFIPAFGYDDSTGTQMYAAYNTWDTSLHWYQFGPMTDEKQWGIFGGTTLSILNLNPLPTISGNVGVAGVTLSYVDGVAKTATSAADGSYSFTVSANWTGTVTPTKACYTFNPTQLSYSNLSIYQNNQNYTYTINSGSGCANIAVTIGGTNRGNYGVPSLGSMRMNYPGVDSGPVMLHSSGAVNIIAAMRDAWSANGTTTSFAQLMGLPSSQLSDTYLFPAYNNVTLNEQLRIGNVDASDTIVTVTIGGVLKGTYPLGPNESTRVNYAGVDSGPVIVQGTPGVHIIAAIRDSWSANGVVTSFVQLMGLPASQVSDTYVFPAYNNVTLNEQLRIGNVDTSDTIVTVTIGGVLKGTYPLGPNASTRVNYAGVDSGPVIVQGTPGVHIIAAIRDSWSANGVVTSFAQLMGLPAGQLSDTYQFPAYNNVTLNEQLRIGNVDTSDTTVTVTIGGVLKGTYPLGPNESTRVNYAGVDSGPVVVQGTSGVHIIAAERDSWASNGKTTSFVQLMGLPAGLLSDTFLFPAYNNVTLNEQLRFGVP